MIGGGGEYTCVVRPGLLIVLAFILTALGCDRAPQAPPVTNSSAPLPERVEARVVAMLPTSRPTHLAVAGDATIWWVQESDDGRDIAFALGSDGVPRATALTTGRVLEASGIEQSGAARGSGHFHSLAVADDGRVWFYFAGGAGRTSVSCVGTFDPRDDSIKIVLDNATLKQATGMGPSLVLARGTLVVLGGDDVWLWVRHSDGAGLFHIDATSGVASRPFDAVTTQTGQTLTLHRPGLAMGTGTGGLLLLDLNLVELWRIDPAGRATSLHSLVGLPAFLSTPAGGAAGRAFVLAADAPLIPARTDEETRQILPVRYPALLVIEPGNLRTIARGDITPPEGFALKEMRVRPLLHEPGTDTLIGYDENSGALLRFQIVAGP